VEQDGHGVAELLASVAATVSRQVAAVSENVYEVILREIPELHDDQAVLALLASSVHSNVGTCLQIMQHQIDLSTVRAPAASLEYARRRAQRGTRTGASAPPNETDLIKVGMCRMATVYRVDVTDRAGQPAAPTSRDLLGNPMLPVFMSVVSRLPARRPRLCAGYGSACVRSGLKTSRNVSASSCGSATAGKWPPRSCSAQVVTLK
jgi:hypothetical protein